MPKTKYPIFKCLHQGEKGFTLIELLIVIAILGIIAAVVIPNLSTFMTSGTLSAANTEAENVKTAALAYYADQNPPAWPNSSDELTSYVAGKLKATYYFDDSDGYGTFSGTNTGFIVGASTNSTGGWGADITWQPPQPGEGGAPVGHGKWVRAS